MPLKNSPSAGFYTTTLLPFPLLCLLCSQEISVPDSAGSMKRKPSKDPNSMSFPLKGQDIGRPAVVVRACELHTWEIAVGLSVQGLPTLRSEIPSLQGSRVGGEEG